MRDEPDSRIYCQRVGSNIEHHVRRANSPPALFHRTARALQSIVRLMLWAQRKTYKMNPRITAIFQLTTILCVTALIAVIGPLSLPAQERARAGYSGISGYQVPLW